jgi:signal peptidase I
MGRLLLRVRRSAAFEWCSSPWSRLAWRYRSRPSLTPCSRPTPEASSQTFIKRVVGVAGDRIALRHGRVVRNGELQAEPYARPCGAPECDLPRPARVPEDFVYLLGDNRGASQDSRFWGPVPVSWVIGEAIGVYWPPGHAGTP